MARIIVGSYMIRYPLGGMMSWVLQYLVGFQRLGHDVYFVEKSGYANSCFDPRKNVMSDDCSYGNKTVNALLKRFDLQDKWCFVDQKSEYYGLSKGKIQAIFDSADVFVDMGTHGAWLDEAAETRLRVMADGEPGFTQIKMENRLANGEPLPDYDFYFTAGSNVGTSCSTAPTAGKKWRLLFHPVVADLFSCQTKQPGANFTTVMNWQSHAPIEFDGKIYGQKDIEFVKFINLPQRSAGNFEVAVSGKNVPKNQLKENGWGIRNAHEVTLSFDSFKNYIERSKGEFTVCKNVFVATNSGWFSDRSAVYLASARPVVIQDTGFSEYLPSGRGLFSFQTVEEAAAAVEEINENYERHSNWAREMAIEYLDSSKVLKKFLDEIGI
jgi:hypothetical protein